MTRCEHRVIQIQSIPPILTAQCDGCSMSAHAPLSHGVNYDARMALIRRIEHLLDRIYVIDHKRWSDSGNDYVYLYRWNVERLF